MKYQVYAKDENGNYIKDMLLDNEQDAAERAEELAVYGGIYEPEEGEPQK